MKISELPFSFRLLAGKRANDQDQHLKYDSVHSSFVFADTPEGDDWWRQVNKAKQVSDLPAINGDEVAKAQYEYINGLFYLTTYSAIEAGNTNPNMEV